MRPRKTAGNGERFFLGLAMLVPLVVAALILTQLPFTGLASASGPLSADDSAQLMGKRPAALNPAPPPTLVPPPPTATPVPQTAGPEASPTPQPAGSYVVQSGDELKSIAAAYNVSMAKIIAANDIPDPDSLRVGQVLDIPAR